MFKLHVSAFHRAIIRLIGEGMFSIQMRLRTVRDLVLRRSYGLTLTKVSLGDSMCG
jgi:hypothetical protein